MEGNYLKNDSCFLPKHSLRRVPAMIFNDLEFENIELAKPRVNPEEKLKPFGKTCEISETVYNGYVRRKYTKKL